MALTKKQKEVYDYILSYNQQNGYAPTQKEIKEHFQLKSFGSVQRYIKYLTQSGLLETDWNARRGLKALAVPDQEMAQNDTNLTDNNGIPLLGDVAAGDPIEALENPTEFISVPPQLMRKNGRYFALKVRGDSMIEDGILEEDYVVCRQQENAQQGQTVVAVVDGEATLKRYYQHSDHIELRPANQRLRPFKITSESGELRIAGVMVGLVRLYE
jgi:repressor LexA